MPEASRAEAPLKLVREAIARSAVIDALGALITLVDGTTPATPAGRIALGFDTNALFRVAGGKRGADVVDYLAGPFPGQLILPGQVIQEVWNNQMSGLSPTAKSLHKKFEELEEEALKLDERFGALGDSIRQQIVELVAVHSRTFDPDALKSFRGLLGIMQTKADIPFVPRDSFHDLGIVRRATKTPPGFKDTGLGDFFVWADFLLGVGRAQMDAPLAAVVFVTMDQKADWSRDGSPHPILQAEAEFVAKAPFSLWALSDLYKFVDSESGSDAARSEARTRGAVAEQSEGS